MSLCPMFGVDELVVHEVVNQWPLIHANPSHHGVSHWMRVSLGGTYVAQHEYPKDANKLVPLIQLFALFHDCRRVDEGRDLAHGLNAAVYLNEWKEFNVLPFTDLEIDRVREACKVHTTAHPDDWSDMAGDPFQMKLVACCLDGDRLDLPRVGIKVDPTQLFTKAAKELIP